jgi:hypothetical protein
MSAKERQEGGSHYRDMVIQPVDFITKNGIGFLEGCVIKRMCRWRAKDGPKDLRKAIHEIELLIEAEEGEVKGAEEESAYWAEQQAKQRLAVKLRHPMTGDRLTTSAEQAVKDFVKAHPEAAGLTSPPLGALGSVLYGWVEIGFMWSGQLVPHEAEG